MKPIFNIGGLSLKNDFIKIIALISMVIDHIGAVIYPNIIIFRIIGRIAFPIFAYQTALGFTKTKDVYKYMFRILLFGIISQPIYGALFKGNWNIMFTLLYSVVVMYIWNIGEIKFKILSMLILMLSIFLPQLDYGFFGILLTFSFMLYMDNRVKSFIIQSMLIVLYSISITVMAQCFAILALPIIFTNWKINIKLSKYTFYIFYPLHLFIILIYYHTGLF